MPQTYIFPLDNMTNVEFTEEDLKEITKNYQLYLKNNPKLAKQEVYTYLKELFTPYIVA